MLESLTPNKQRVTMKLSAMILRLSHVSGTPEPRIYRSSRKLNTTSRKMMLRTIQNDMMSLRLAA